MIYQNKKFYLLSFKGGKFTRLVKGNEYNEYDIVKDSGNNNIINKYIKDNKIKVFAKIDL